LTDHTGENTLSVVVDRVVEGVSNAICYLSTHNNNNGSYDFEMTVSKLEAVHLSGGHSCYLLLPTEHLVIIPDFPQSE